MPRAPGDESRHGSGNSIRHMTDGAVMGFGANFPSRLVARPNRSIESLSRRSGIALETSVSSVVVPLGSVEASALQAALLESGDPTRMGRGRCDPTSRMNSLLPCTTRSPRLTLASLG
jgi:hypothetical protein